MKTIRYGAVAVTLLMSVMDLPAAFDDSNVPRGAGVAATCVGVAGLVVAVALLRRLAWAPTAVVIVGAVNLVGGLVAIAKGWQGGPIGTALSLAIIALGVACLAGDRRHNPVAA